MWNLGSLHLLNTWLAICLAHPKVHTAPEPNMIAISNLHWSHPSWWIAEAGICQTVATKLANILIAFKCLHPKHLAWKLVQLPTWPSCVRILCSYMLVVYLYQVFSRLLVYHKGVVVSQSIYMVHIGVLANLLISPVWFPTKFLQLCGAFCLC